MTKDRWPTVYDSKELEEQIKKIVKDNYSKGFYSLTPRNSELFQGDIIFIEKKFLFIDLVDVRTFMGK